MKRTMLVVVSLAGVISLIAGHGDMREFSGGPGPGAGGGGAAGGRGSPSGRTSPGVTYNGHPTDARGARLSPAGQPMNHNPQFSSRSRAAEAARRAGSGNIIEHKDHRHFHATDGKGNKKPGVHFNYGVAATTATVVENAEKPKNPTTAQPQKEVKQTSETAAKARSVKAEKPGGKKGGSGRKSGSSRDSEPLEIRSIKESGKDFPDKVTDPRDPVTMKA